MWRVGERVRFLDEEGEATVIRVLSDGSVEVEDEYGLQSVHRPKELVPVGIGPKDSSELKAAPAPDVPASDPISVRPQVVASEPLPELALIFMSDRPERPEAGDIELYFHNGSEFHMLVNVSARDGQGFCSLFSGEVRQGTIEHLRPVRRQDVDIFSQIAVDCIFFRESEYAHREAFSTIVRMKPTRFVRPGSYGEVSGLEGMGMVVPVERAAPPVNVSSGALTVRVSERRKAKEIAQVLEREVDLHIEHLVSDFSTMTDHEMLLCQCSYADRCINEGLTGGLFSITFIHGVGKGRLREEVRALAAELGLRYEDGPFHRYGQGATVVYLR